jgi:tRNA A37 N6-isopentenylltransferase MiaA
MTAFLRDEIGRGEALEAGRAATRQYAKRQSTWFSRQPPAQWPRFTQALEGRAEAGEALSLLTRASLSSAGRPPVA